MKPYFSIVKGGKFKSRENLKLNIIIARHLLPKLLWHLIISEKFQKPKGQ